MTQPVLKLHHLSDSRSQKTLWLLEELGLHCELYYSLHNYQRGSDMRAPPEFKALHPLATAPLLEADGKFYPESGAIAEYLLRQFGGGHLAPAIDSDQYLSYQYWMHFGVAKGMQPIMYKVRAPGHGLTGSSYDKAAEDEMADVLDYLDAELEGREYLLGENFSAADIQVSFVPELANVLGQLDEHANIRQWLRRLYGRPAFQRSLEIGGAYHFSVIAE